MTFKADVFEQAKDYVANKPWDEQIKHSRVFHSIRSAISSKGSAASKGIGLTVTVGKAFLSLIPIPVLGAVTGAIVSAVDQRIRGSRHDKKLKDTSITTEDKIKFLIKTLDVSNLDRYRWKLHDALEHLRTSTNQFNTFMATAPTEAKDIVECDRLFELALNIAQAERRKEKLKNELKQFRDLISVYEEWTKEVDNGIEKTKEEVNERINKVAGAYKTATQDPQAALTAGAIVENHKACTNWCCVKLTEKYDASSFGKMKERIGDVVNATDSLRMALLTVKAGDYRFDSQNSVMR